MLIGNLFNDLPKKLKLHEFRNLSFDSRYCKNKDIFFSIKGTYKNGNKAIIGILFFMTVFTMLPKLSIEY